MGARTMRLAIKRLARRAALTRGGSVPGDPSLVSGAEIPPRVPAPGSPAADADLTDGFGFQIRR
jgi:hypothetical protein